MQYSSPTLDLIWRYKRKYRLEQDDDDSDDEDEGPEVNDDVLRTYRFSLTV